MFTIIVDQLNHTAEPKGLSKPVLALSVADFDQFVAATLPAKQNVIMLTYSEILQDIFEVTSSNLPIKI